MTYLQKSCALASLLVAFTSISCGSDPAPSPSCVLTLAPTLATVSSAGGTLTFTVAASANRCTWSAVSNASWLTIASGASRTGDAVVTVQAAANTAAARTGQISLAATDAVATVTQAAISGTLTGTVRNASTNAVVAGATVAIGSASTTTSATGVFSLTGPVGAQTLTTTATGFVIRTDSVTIVAGQTVTFNVSLTQLSVTVFDAASFTGSSRTFTTDQTNLAQVLGPCQVALGGQWD